MPRDITVAVGVRVLEIDFGVPEMAGDVPDRTVGVPKMDIGVFEVGVGVSTIGFAPSVMGMEDAEGDADVLVIDTVFLGACGTVVGGESILTGKSSVRKGDASFSVAAALGYWILPGCVNFFMGILNFGL